MSQLLNDRRNPPRTISPLLQDRRKVSRVHWTSILQRIHLDGLLVLGIVALMVFSAVVLYSSGGEDISLLIRQGVRMAIAIAAMIILAQIQPDRFKDMAFWVYGIGVLMLVAVLLFGTIGKGAQRWLDLGFFRFQPSEIMKLAVPMAVAVYLAERPLPPSFARLFMALLMIAIPVVLIGKQPDLGTALLIASSGLIVVFLSGMSWRLLMSFIVLCASAAPVLWYFMHDYQRRRVMTLFNPESDPLGAGYHIIQSKIAIGSGGLHGRGWLQGTQSHLEFLPERSTDFIFAVIAEEFGLIGLVMLITVYLLITARGLYIAAQAQMSYMKLLAGSIAITFLVYVFVNVGMVTGLLPVVGVPLPLISYGGTSMVTLLAGFGILMSIHTHRRMMSP
ncbi:MULTISPECIES: rod shape-determining protein RodA [unclassified Methylophaga]|jgi:rod shape determining protein RodA|uniref:rod shape-determining protein RodA n=1 Tax=unclassified Methylophaga TaxID=2629249 RepID=UPI000C925CE3|nr:MULTISPECIES: rod shape-determining protein RodA [unclassified Methylophaga]MAK66414.1 rod shape-determining protein RodA [Methylophaga sp.]MAY17108.1 rod shape-determining protein RodA [Methylophaga sp.]HAO26445.1 rod shape-determining protein RodA [Methylophaga sp.]|tara:strand:- start:7065 stop:8237 length:1173 start_codon:yes stop_codon:yes gene_type:complete